MSDFLLIVPEGWRELPDAPEFVERHTAPLLIDAIEREAWGELDAVIEEVGGFEPGQTISNVRLLNGGAGWQLWYQVVDIPGWTPPTE
jgi:hypothetical protein